MATQKKKTSGRKKSSTRSKKKQSASFRLEITGVILIAIGVIGLLQLGFVGRGFFALAEMFVGLLSYVLLAGSVILGGYMVIRRKMPHLFSKRLVGIYLIVLGFLTYIHMYFIIHNLGANASVVSSTWKLVLENLFRPNQVGFVGGGMIGAAITSITYFLLDRLGTNLIAVLLIIYGFSLVSGISIRQFFSKIAEFVRYLFMKGKVATEKGKEVKAKRDKKKAEKIVDVEPDEVIDVIEPLQEEKTPPIISNFSSKVEQEKAPVEEKISQKEQDLEMFQQESFENEIYQLPPVDILAPAKVTDQSKEYDQIKVNAKKLEDTFESFGVKAKITQVHLGPAVTKYEVQPSVGVKVSKIVSLSDDIALALAAKDIRIEAPIPGKSAIGIEVANQNVAMVSLREVLENNPKNNPDEKLQIALGRDISGEAMMANLDKMPHLLVAGATGSGKSVCINGIITSILLRAKPHEVKMMMIDPKMVELNVYNGIPHLLAPVVTNPKKAAQALQKVVAEMERRYDLFSHTGTRNMQGYNDYVKKHNELNEEKQPELPFIVVIVDELADLMMVASNDVEDAITRLAQMARAAGIHLIIATQRPSVDVITGVIKANIPSRIAFAVSSSIDSRTILDMGGAEKLLGRGDMLLLPVGSSKPTRIQGAFLSDAEVEDVVNYVISQQKAQYSEEMIPDDIPEVEGEVTDELYHEAVELVVEMQTASVSMLQRKFRIGYNRAARLIDEMEQRGVVGPHEGSKPRRVNVEVSPEHE
ncbi:DNA translocase FtsK [Listeria monocytogenes]|uniref:DNA translocase FtsK n=1 Tax=Listeria monocytogenes TaxID=1639 RepID=A0A3T2FZI4_LISMN|nr:DNA translocase FtsK [Listeria monocytogenes]EAG6269776.1 DNA translocase FtsK [Listeria monocytogenes CFSAN003726]EAG6274615.1 DNA translocase FtsK [Listeria monocytogenes CFSAN003808]EAG6279195.1 DNA translocase FtsK [Listeria monocytogenes CFSAN003809]EAG6357950.1 DNA translocase FtsK [Listeria monocytogenes CFSAN003729]EAG6366938.1 DNA translocase FtsK [Listeria monocytogenes CFSAN003728]EAH4395918.1 DNA translocase FtsK [Listeria monocytogenes serotype 3a]EHC5243926.1 DNA translocase